MRVNNWLRGICYRFNQVTTILSLMVGFFCASLFGHHSPRTGSITVTDEVSLTRTTSLPSGTRVASFRDSVRDRDRRCVITGWPVQLAQFGNWRSFDATHIFPLAYEEHWNQLNYARWITIPPANECDGSINSVQNGILLRSDIRDYFDSYDLAINPDV